MTTTTPDQYLTTADAAAALGVSYRTLARMIAAGDIPAVNIARPSARRRTLRVASAAVDAYLRRASA